MSRSNHSRRRRISKKHGQFKELNYYADYHRDDKEKRVVKRRRRIVDETNVIIGYDDYFEEKYDNY